MIRNDKGQRARTYAREDFERVAGFLRESPETTLTYACVKAKVSYYAMRQAVRRFRDVGGSEEEMDLAAVVVEAIEWQTQQLLERGNAAADNPTLGRATSWWQWRLENKNPTEFNQRRQVELSGPNGGPIDVRAEMATMTHEELIAQRLDNDSIANGAGDDE